MKIALDVMGGDDAPSINFEGAVSALEINELVELLLVGETDALESAKPSFAPFQDRIEYVASEGVITMDDKPTEALRKKPNSSIAMCWRLMAEKQADAIVSAGNTGAVVAAGLRTRLFLSGVKRPGIAVVLPTLKGSMILLDVGANPAARAEHLVQYGIMGTVYARKMLNLEEVRLGILNIGSEDGKGIETVREARELLGKHPATESSFIGNIEGRGLYHGEADVVVCEGFVGNVLLKASEGMADMMMQVTAGHVLAALDDERQKAQAAFGELARKYRYSETGGAPLLGIDGSCLICHGSSDKRSIHNAILASIKYNDLKINSLMSDALNL